MIDVFLRSTFIVLSQLPGLLTVWMQIEISNRSASKIAKAADVIQNCCPKAKHRQLIGELRKAGIYTGVISSKL